VRRHLRQQLSQPLRAGQDVEQEAQRLVHGQGPRRARWSRRLSPSTYSMTRQKWSSAGRGSS
jgi:hypothetical protein